MNGPISTELQGFIVRYIHSIERLEILYLLAENPGKNWSEEEIFKVIQSSQRSIANALRFFTSDRFLVYEKEKGGYRFAPSSEELGRITGELMETYKQRRVTVIELIYTLRRDPIQQFSDAFKIRKEDI